MIVLNIAKMETHDARGKILVRCLLEYLLGSPVEKKRLKIVMPLDPSVRDAMRSVDKTDNERLQISI